MYSTPSVLDFIRLHKTLLQRQWEKKRKILIKDIIPTHKKKPHLREQSDLQIVLYLGQLRIKYGLNQGKPSDFNLKHILNEH